MQTKKLIIVCAVIIILIASLSYAILSTIQTETSIKVDVDNPVYKNDTIKIKLTDKDGNALSNKTVTLFFTDKNDKTKNKTVTTGDNGIAKYKVKLSKGTYSLLGVFSGDKDYKSSNFTYDLKVKEKKVNKSSSNKNYSSKKTSSSSSYNNEYSYLDDEPGLEKVYDPATGKVYYHDLDMESEGAEFVDE